MVLQSNFAKHADTENTPPSSQHGGKSFVSRIRSSLHEAARRRRARTNGVARTSKYAVEQAKRRSLSKSPATTIRFNVNTITAPPITDVEMKEAEPSFATTTIPITLPRELGRPEYCDISPEAISAVDPELSGTDVSYLREGLEEFGPKMLQVLSSVKGNPIKDALPKELSIIVHDLSSAAPSHMLAVYGPPSKKGSTEKRKVTLYPAHSLIFAAYCSKLPPFPPTDVPTISQPGAPQELSVPIRPLCLPSPQSYPRLSSFLYTKRTDALLQSLMPCQPPAILLQWQEQEQGISSQLIEFSAKLAGTYTTQALLQHTMTAHGLWQNVCALGIFDDSLWETIDLAWQILLTAIAIGTGNPQAMIAPPSSCSEQQQQQPSNTQLQTSSITSPISS